MHVIALTIVLLLTVVAPARAIEDAQRCDAAAARAETAFELPTGILSAVGTVESGRLGEAGSLAPWPWTINVAGRGYVFATKRDAIAGTLQAMRDGKPLIDIGCFQVDILYHAGAFRSLEDAFDPDRNAIEAAKILAAARQRTTDWATTVAWYHSADPARGAPYLQRVRSAYPQARGRAWAANLSLVLEQAATAGALPTVIYGGPLLPRSADRQDNHKLLQPAR